MSMAIGIDGDSLWGDLIDDDTTDVQQEDPKPEEDEKKEDPIENHEEKEDDHSDEEEEDNHDDPHEEENQKDDLITALLKSKGIDDPTKIKFENDNNEIEELDWNNLTREEQLNILKEEDAQDNNDLDDEEIDLINRLRLSGMTPEEFIAVIKQQGVAEYMQNNAPEVHHKVDDLSDDELYLLDLQARVGEISDDELQEALDRAKSNEALFAKEIAGLREEYKKYEDTKNQQDAALKEQEMQENFNNYANSIVDSINGFNSLGELDVDMNNDDKNELYEFLTGTDNAGVSYIQKALSDPDTLVRMAWFALKGEDVINSISEYYKGEITKAHRAGYEEGKKKSAPKKEEKETKVVVKKTPETKEVNTKKSIEDLW